MQAFLIGLQFLTRIKVVNQTVWTEEDFGKSVRYFPLVGAVLGGIYAIFAYAMLSLLPDYLDVHIPFHFASFVLLALPVLLTGGIHCDGFMDSMDGLFSGRPRDRMLEIMKDSRVGSFGVVTFVLLMLCNWSLLLDISQADIVAAVFVMPIISRMMMVYAVSCFPYARPEGMGKAFAKYAERPTVVKVFLYSFLFIIPWGWEAVFACLLAFLFASFFGRFATRKLGGLTGDVYGAICTLCETVVLLAFLMAEGFFGGGIIC